MKTVEIRQMESAELQEQLGKKREELFRLRLNWYAGSLENPNQMRVVRKDIARILTILRERELALEVVQNEEEPKKDVQ
ncbi:MAG: 50S ribosomal protein L29 [Anaerolinea sp.]|nr:50S ribosomal protein L29 [Anaerolinea sp.]MCC6972672.1 50S ribosomal protein L29 [Anaerolineae bacterium]CAG1006142.1 50S ribosomal protein L29 [Anaerolineae bacterium]